MVMKKPKKYASNITVILKNAFRLLIDPNYKAKFTFAGMYGKLPVNDKVIFIEAFNGDSITGSPFYMLQDICKDERFADYEIYVGSVKEQLDNIRHQLEVHGLDRAVVIQRHTRKFCKVLATAKYIISDVSLPTYYIKQEGQIYLNTWHGTPLKGLGRSIMDNPNSIGNVQRNFLMSDYLLYPNKYTFEVMRRDYMIGPFFKGQYILGGYPRNAVLFDNKKAAKLKKKLGFKGKKIIVYMPTWRSTEKDEQIAYHSNMLEHILKTLDKGVDKDTVVIAKLHHLAKGSLNFDEFKNVIAFPDDYETYEVLAMADCLITDYSSVLFDFAVTGRKVILHAYDREEYQNTRSMYMNIEQLPFIITEDTEELVKAVNNPNFKDYTEEIRPYVEYDNINASKQLLEYVFFGTKSDSLEIIDGSTYHNDKKNILLFTGNLAKNGITTAMMGIINNIDLSQYNYVLTFYQASTQANRMLINQFSKDLYYIPMQGPKCMTYFESLCHYLFFKWNVDIKSIRKVMDRVFAREVQRDYYGIKFDTAIHFTGYERYVVHIINNMDTKKVIYTHNDLIQESKTRDNIHYPTLVRAYEDYDKVVIIRESMLDEIKRNAPFMDETKIQIAHNINNIELIRSRAQLPVAFEEDTVSNATVERINEILDDENAMKFIDIARFSNEKGLDRLIHGFEKFTQDYPNSYLFIIGGLGNQFEEIWDYVEKNNLERIILIKAMSNPYPILNKCSAYILSSRYEGLPMTIMEALILDKPLVSTNIPGPAEFLKSNGCGLLVEDSEEGVLDGYYAYVDGRLDKLNKFDAEGFNRQAIQEFYNIFND